MHMYLFVIIAVGSVIAIIAIFSMIFAKSREEKREFDRIHAKRLEIARSIAADFDSIGWIAWGYGIHLLDGQSERMMRAANSQSMKLLGYDPKTHRACVQGEHGIVYDLDEQGCSCPDFRQRQLPCKHMYFVLLEVCNSEDD